MSKAKLQESETYPACAGREKVVTEKDNVTGGKEKTSSPHLSSPHLIAQFRKIVMKQVPNIGAFGLVFWSLWNTIAFTGSFWLHSPDNFRFGEELIYSHLLSATITLVIFFILVSIFKSKAQAIFLDKRVLFLATLISIAGTALIFLAREDYLASSSLFHIGSYLTGVGTTFIFLKGMSIIVQLHPKRMLLNLSLIMLFSSALYLIMRNCSDDFNVILFILLPLFSFVIFLIPTDKPSTNGSGFTDAHLAKRSVVLFVFIMLGSAAFELCKGQITVSLPPTTSTGSIATASLFQLLIFSVLAFIAIATDKQKTNYIRISSVAFGALFVILVFSVLLYDEKSITMATAVSAVTPLFNMCAWMIFCYIAYQCKTADLRIVALGNAALSVGTGVGSKLITSLFSSTLSDSDFKLLMFCLVVVIIALLIFILSGKYLQSLLSAVDDETPKEDNPAPKKWVELCKEVGTSYGLSPREQEIMVALATGRSADEIAAENVVSIYTVRAHVRSVYQKMDVHSKKELVALIKDFKHTESSTEFIEE